MTDFAVIRTPAFESLAKDYARDHSALPQDLEWLTGRFGVNPEMMGDHVPELANLKFPVFKARCKDSCHCLGASGAWRIYYALDKPKGRVFLLFLHHKKEYDLPRQGFLLQKLERALAQVP